MSLQLVTLLKLSRIETKKIMSILLSIIIPCYNSQQTLEETLVSVMHQDFNSWEAIIVNDGSPDNLEAIALKYVEKDSRFKYFKKENGGLASARNFGIKQSKGEYILPLDSDNKIRPDFAQKAFQLFGENINIGVVYGDAMYFGEREGLWKVGDFDKHRMLNHNYIDACAIVKKEVFDSVGLYDEKLPHQGHEDWDFWLRGLANNTRFYYLEEITFDYRVTSNSMIRTFDKNMMEENIKYIKKKNCELYIAEYNSQINKINLCESEIKRIKNNIFYKFLRKFKLI